MNGMPVKEKVKRRQESDWYPGISPSATAEHHQNGKPLGGEKKGGHIKRDHCRYELLDVTSCCCEGGVVSPWCRWAPNDVKRGDIGKKNLT